MPWTVYVLLSESATTYVGIALDAERRLAQHNGELRGGAKSTRGSRPWRIAKTYGPYDDRGIAQSAEYEVKRLRGHARLSWGGFEARDGPSTEGEPS